MIVNWYARDMGWLFEDLKRHAVRVGHPGHEVTAANEPDPQADAWVCVRTSEGVKSPDLSRTVVQVHDLFTDPPFDYGPESPRGIAVRGAGAMSFTHFSQTPEVCGCFLESGASERVDRPYMCRPIGALRAFQPRTAADRQDVFTVGFSGRPVTYKGRELKRVAMFVAAIKLLGPPVRVLMFGEGLSRYRQELWDLGHQVCWYKPSLLGNWEDYAPNLYRQLDAFCATSESPAVPLGCYEALASGVPVISTPREWPTLGHGVYTSMNVQMMADQLGYLRDGVMFAGVMGPKMDPGTPESIAADVADFKLEAWCAENTALAAGLA